MTVKIRNTGSKTCQSTGGSNSHPTFPGQITNPGLFAGSPRTNCLNHDTTIHSAIYPALCYLCLTPLRHKYWRRWVLLGPAWCKLFSAVFITLFALHVSDVIHIHPQERYKMYVQMVQVSARVSWPVPRRVWIPTALNNLHQAGPNKTQIATNFIMSNVVFKGSYIFSGGGRGNLYSIVTVDGSR